MKLYYLIYYYNLFITKKDASGYVEDGRDFFEDEDDISDEDIPKSSEKANRKRPRDGGGSKTKQVKGLSQKVLFGNVLSKKSTITSIKDDTVLTDLLKELRNESEKTVDTALVVSSKSTTSRIVAPAISSSNGTSVLDTKLCKEQLDCTENHIQMKSNETVAESTSQIKCNEETAKVDMLKELPTESNSLAVDLPPKSISEIDSKTIFNDEDNNYFIENSDFFNQGK